MIRKIYLISNKTKDKDYVFTKEVISFLKENEKEVYADKTYEGELEGLKYISDDELEDMDLVLVLGGDGTIIGAAKRVLDKKLSIVGINLGSLGFLADIEQESYKEKLKEIFEGKYVCIERSMLNVKVMSYKESKLKFKAIGFNDVVLARDGISRMVGFSVYINGIYVDDYSADGALLSTSVGSTAYNLSAGGPILAPTSDTIVFTPICPHSFSARSIVLSDKDRVKIDFNNNKKTWEAGMILTVDGGIKTQLEKDDYIVIEKSSKKTKLISPKTHDFYRSLRHKLKTY